MWLLSAYAHFQVFSITLFCRCCQIYSTSLKEHVHHLEAVFKCLKEANLKLKLSKWQSFKKHLHYLGHLISEQGVYTRYTIITQKSVSYTTPKRTQQCERTSNLSWAWQVIIESLCCCLLTLPNPSTNFSGRTQSSSGHSNVKQPSNMSNKLFLGTHPAVA